METRSRVTEEQLSSIRHRILETIDFSQVQTDDAFLSAIERIVAPQARTQGWTAVERLGIVTAMMNYFRGFDAIGPLLEDETVTEIMVNGPKDIFFERSGRVYRYDAVFENGERLEHLIQRIVARVNRSINEANPLVDARLADGSRVHAVFPPIALNGPILTIRKFPSNPYTMERLISMGTLPVDAAQFLAQLVRAKYNLFVSGGTGSGKTTLLNVLAQCIPEMERVITIEDAAELQLHQLANLVVLETRPPNTEGKGELTIRQLIRAALRMRPDRIVVGEVRGGEALDMLQAMNTGHEGSLSTGHANSVHDMLHRLETMMLLGAELPLAAMQQQIVSAIHVVVHLARKANHARKVTEISEVVAISDGQYVLNPLYVWNNDAIAPALVPTGNPLRRHQKWDEVYGCGEQRNGRFAPTVSFGEQSAGSFMNM